MFFDKELLRLLYNLDKEKELVLDELFVMYHQGFVKTVVEFINKYYTDEIPEYVDLEKINNLDSSLKDEAEDYQSLVVEFSMISQYDQLFAEQYESLVRDYNKAIMTNRVSKMNGDQINELQKYINQAHAQKEDQLFALLTILFDKNDLDVKKLISE